LKDEVEGETAGDPMSGKKWQRSSLRQVSRKLKEAGHAISAPTVARLLKAQNYSLKANNKRLAGASHPDRNAQFEYLQGQKQAFLTAGLPVISVDTKKKELIGNFKNAGRSWCQEAEAVNDHDFEHDALGKGAPYGIYNLNHNLGSVCVGTSADTPQFAVDAIAQWWSTEGSHLFPTASKILILADAGGSNGCRPHLWKQQLQEQLADRLGLEVTVCHYPTGTSKWNPVEHRLFGPISLNWAGKPLRTFEIMLAWIRGTTTQTGLTVNAWLNEKKYQKGIKVAKDVFRTLNIYHHPVCPNWNYTIQPHGSCT
jgi:Rhodopirellula transposase DDE domain